MSYKVEVKHSPISVIHNNKDIIINPTVIQQNYCYYDSIILAGSTPTCFLDTVENYFVQKIS